MTSSRIYSPVTRIDRLTNKTRRKQTALVI